MQSFNTIPAANFNQVDADTTSKQRKQSNKPSGQPLYPYAPDDYQKIEIVGHTLVDGMYVPVKLFANVDAPPQSAWKIKESSFLWGIVAGSILTVVCMLVMLIFTT